jgi:hypothetical protein
MGTVPKSSILHGLSGGLGKQIVLKAYKDKTVISAYPDMSDIKRTALQKGNNSKFSKAVKYAQNIIRNPKLKAAYVKKLAKGVSVYHAAIREFMGRE